LSKLKAFALIDEVQPNSPSASAGLCVGDECIHFAGIEFAPHDSTLLPRIASAVQASVAQPLRVVVRRDNRTLTLSLTPNAWQGRGLLGCHIKPLQV
jgi:26S proteasome non-ATPase regulatory subunit 9